MGRYWWVNHSQTYEQEVVTGGYLWAPKTEADGKRSRFYENLPRVSTGDRVVSYAGTKISALGRAEGLAFTAAKPREFGATGGNWGHAGWLIPMSWDAVVHPFRPKDYIDRLRPHLPKKYSPLRPETGSGNQKAYPCEINEAIYSLVNFLAGGISPKPLASSSRSELVDRIENEIQAELASHTALSASERLQIFKARKGQGLFRRNVEAIEPMCRLTHISTPVLLTASHMKPWRSCETTEERLDGNNGLLLAGHVDRLFDRGMISFCENGALLISRQLDPEDVKKMGLSAAFERGVGSFSRQQARYLAYHRENVFLDRLLDKE